SSLESCSPKALRAARACARTRRRSRNASNKTSNVSHPQTNQKKRNRQGRSWGFNHPFSTVKPAITMTTATSSENPIVFRRERSSRSNPRVTCTVKGTIQKPFFGGRVSMGQRLNQKQRRVLEQPAQL